jgi:hypothetical protein
MQVMSCALVIFIAALGQCPNPEAPGLVWCLRVRRQGVVRGQQRPYWWRKRHSTNLEKFNVNLEHKLNVTHEGSVEAQRSALIRNHLPGIIMYSVTTSSMLQDAPRRRATRLS